MLLQSNGSLSIGPDCCCEETPTETLTETTSPTENERAAASPYASDDVCYQ